jgi:transcriptional regulator GlxA family with amidase domain
LRYAFQEVCGVSPKRFALRQRLRAARETLRTADPDQITVTEVATLYGFFELGRFAGQYKAAFGETPSRTLRARVRHPLQQAG